MLSRSATRGRARTDRAAGHPAGSPQRTAIGGDTVDATELCFTPATELSRLIAARELSPVELAEAALARIDRLNPLLNAYLTVTPDLAREQARAAEERARRGERRGPL